MASLTSISRRRSFISKEIGEGFPVFDITGEQARKERLNAELNQASGDLNWRFGQEVRLLLDQSALNITCGKWADNAPDTDLVWMESSCDEYPGQRALLGLDRRSLFSVSELFFAGNPCDLTDKDIKKRDITDTDTRLISRLLSAAIGIVSDNLGIEPCYWNTEWSELVDTGGLFWTEFEIAGESWSISIHLGWPCSFRKEEAQVAPVFTREEISSQLERAPVRLAAELASLTITMADLNNLSTGDIIEFDLQQNITATAHGVPCVSGKIFESDDRLGLRIDHNAGTL